jgi:MOSC domain-containing protein YiiM
VDATILSVNVGTPRDVEWQGRIVTSAIWKAPVDGAVLVAGVNLSGDDQADRRVHGGRDKAVYAYASEDYAWWSRTVDVGPASFGENLTTRGIDLTACAVGDRWQIGDVTLEVVQPRHPCFKLGMRMNDESFPGKFKRAGRPGAYLRIITEGTVAAGDAILVTPTSEPRITLAEMFGA